LVLVKNVEDGLNMNTLRSSIH